MLKTIPFYGCLIGKPLKEDGKVIKATHRHVLLYGAVEAHDFGEYGCIASNKTLADETGFSPLKISEYLRELREAGWVNYEIDENGKRGVVKPCLVLGIGVAKNSGGGSQKKVTPSPKNGDIDNITDNSLEYIYYDEVNTPKKEPEKPSKPVKKTRAKAPVELVNSSGDIASVITYFYNKLMPATAPVFSTTNRKVADSLITTYGLEDTIKSIDTAKSVLGVQYKPQVSSLTGLSMQFEKLKKLAPAAMQRLRV